MFVKQITLACFPFAPNARFIMSLWGNHVNIIALYALRYCDVLIEREKTKNYLFCLDFIGR